MNKFEAVFLGQKNGKVTFFKVHDAHYEEYEAPVALGRIDEVEGLAHGEQILLGTNSKGFIDDVQSFRKPRKAKRPRCIATGTTYCDKKAG